MQFKHPELLYALILLVIPIIVHLFQLRKFQKQEFTNVKFLQRVILQTRKSSVIKKWLTLFARLLALASIIIAFAQPFITQTDTATKPQETVIYLDNSYSMQAKGPRGELLKRAIQELLETLPEDETFTLFTNSNRFKNITTKSNRNGLLQLDYTAQKLSLTSALLRAKNEFTERKESIKNFIAISDFQLNTVDFEPIETSIDINLVQLQPVNKNNLSIDSVYIKDQNISSITLSAKISASGEMSGTFPISLYDDNNLLAKTSIELKENETGFVEFTIADVQSINGSVRVEDTGLKYDNIYYFSINEAEPITIVAISDADDAFLTKLYDDSKEFNFNLFRSNTVDYNTLSTANTIILNELASIPNGLPEIASQLISNNGTVVIIPSQDAGNVSYIQSLNALNIPRFSSIVEQEKKITKITFEHPIYKDVFNTRVDNFQYPTVQSYYALNTSGNTVLSYADDSPFLKEQNGVYIFSAPINTNNSNFKNAPLIVPTFYNIAKQSLTTGDISYTIGNTQRIDVPISLNKDGVLTVSNKTNAFIPLQQNFNSKVQLDFKELPQLAGNYNVTNNTKTLRQLSFNYDRAESDLTYQNISSLDNVTINNQVSKFFEDLQQRNSISQLWKWFIIFALLFLLIELLLLKYLK